MPVQVSLEPIAVSGLVTNLKRFELGAIGERAVADGNGIGVLIGQMAKLESIRLCVDQFSDAHLFGGDFPHLHSIDITYNNSLFRFDILGINDRLPKLRRLSLDAIAIIPQPDGEANNASVSPANLRDFFRTKHLKALEYLTIRNRQFGDAGLEELLASGFITRIKGLDLCRCNITDEGAAMLANHPHVQNLEYLHLGNNLLSPIGLEALEAVGHVISPTQMFGPQVEPFADDFGA